MTRRFAAQPQDDVADLAGVARSSSCIAASASQVIKNVHKRSKDCNYRHTSYDAASNGWPVA
jgi:hypothetical protein